ncbi:hypothetical protein IJG72_04820 [bacterium]|nr:hypothetical protein [bacterium]
MQIVVPVKNVNKIQESQNQSKSNLERNKSFQMSKDGILVDNFIKDSAKVSPCCNITFDDICDKLLISQTESQMPNSLNTGSSFSFKKAVMPLLVGTAAAFGGVALLSSVILKSSKSLASAKHFEKLPDLARNMNIKQEPQFATYRALRNPNTKNIIGAVGVFLYSGLTIAAKNFIDGVKEIWVKKQQADIERDLQEKLIDTETKSFAGKIRVTNEILKDNVNYFKKVLDNKITFSGKNIEKEEESNKDKGKSNLKFVLLSLGLVAGAILAGKYSISNIRKALNNANDFTNNFTNRAIDAIEKLAKEQKPDLKKMEELFQVINAKPDYITSVLERLNVPKSEIERIIKSVDESKKTLFANAPTALGGVPEKIQYYCYLDEDRGHLYNWIVNPENKFLKAIFLSFATVSSVGYTVKQGFDALKEVAVSRENAKTELNLKKRLVQVEVENFKSKKKAAYMPMIDKFNIQLNSKKKPEELKSLAENILLEIKNGPPYIFG